MAHVFVWGVQLGIGMKSPIASLADSLNPCRCYATRESEKNAHCVGIFKYGRAIYFNGRFNSRWRQIFGHIQAHLLQFKVQYKHQLRNVAFPFVFVQSNNTFKIFTFYLHYLRFSEPAKKWDLEKLAFTHIPLSFRVMSMKINVKPLMNSLRDKFRLWVVRALMREKEEALVEKGWSKQTIPLCFLILCVNLFLLKFFVQKISAHEVSSNNNASRWISLSGKTLRMNRSKELFPFLSLSN